MAVFGMVSAVAGFVKVRFLADKAVIDNMVFRMHYRITCAILFLCCILVTANNLIGKSIPNLIASLYYVTDPSKYLKTYTETKKAHNRNGNDSATAIDRSLASFGSLMMAARSQMLKLRRRHQSKLYWNHSFVRGDVVPQWETGPFRVWLARNRPKIRMIHDRKIDRGKKCFDV